MTDRWAQWVDHVCLAIVYGMEAETAAELGDSEGAGLLRWEAARHRYEADRLAERGT